MTDSVRAINRPNLYAMQLVLACLLGCFVSAAAQAHEPGSAAPFKRNTIELRGGIGGIDADSQEVFNDLNDTDTAHAAFGYWLNLNRNFSLGVQYLDGESDDYEFSFFGILNDSVLEYNAVLVSAEGRFLLGRENYLFARLGASFYDYDIVNDRANDRLASDDGTDIHFAAGWRKNLASGLGFEALYEYLPLGDDIEISTIGAGISYSF